MILYETRNKLLTDWYNKNLRAVKTVEKLHIEIVILSTKTYWQIKARKNANQFAKYISLFNPFVFRFMNFIAHRLLLSCNSNFSGELKNFLLIHLQF